MHNSYNGNQILVQEKRKTSTYAKAVNIASKNHIHKSSQGDIWMIQSQTLKGKFYKVEYFEGDLVCDCPAFTFGTTKPCKHIISISIKEIA